MKRLRVATNDGPGWARALEALVSIKSDASYINSVTSSSLTGGLTSPYEALSFKFGGRCYGPAAQEWQDALEGVNVGAAVCSYGTTIAVAVETTAGPRWIAPLEFKGAHSVTTSRHQGTLRRSGVVTELRAADLPTVLFANCFTPAQVETATVLFKEGMSLADAERAALALEAVPA